MQILRRYIINRSIMKRYFSALRTYFVYIILYKIISFPIHKMHIIIGVFPPVFFLNYIDFQANNKEHIANYLLVVVPIILNVTYVFVSSKIFFYVIAISNAR